MESPDVLLATSNGLVDAQVQGNQDKLGKIGMGLMLRRGDKLGDRLARGGP